MPHWINKSELDKKQALINENTYQWLVFANHLTNTLKKTRANFSLTVVSQSLNQPNADDIEAFKPHKIDAHVSLIRKVCLNSDNQAMVFARVIIPISTYLAYQTEIDSLKTAPIGDTLLYKDKEMIRKNFEYLWVQPPTPLFKELQENHWVTPTETCWARRSIFILPKGPLLISEVFLNNIPTYPAM